MIRAVLDTNVIVSALLYRGPTSQLVPLWQSKKVTPLVSKAIVEEHFRVLAYPRFHLSVNEVHALIERQLLPFAQPVHVREVPQVIRADASDDIFLACAVEGKAHYLVSGDRHLLALKRYKGIPILLPAEFISKVKR